MKLSWALGAAMLLSLQGCGLSPVQQKTGAAAPPPRGAPSATAPATAPGTPPVLDLENYRLAPGDMVKVEVLNEPDLSVPALIDPVGNINYPFLGHIQAAGLTTRMLEQRIYAGLKSGYLVNPDVRVNISQYRPVYVSGQVRQAGAYPYSNGLTVEKVLTLAGGVTQFGSTRRMYVQRANAAPDHKEPVEMSSPVFPGDTLVVQERLF